MKILINDVLSQQEKTIYWLAKNIGISYANTSNMCKGKTTSIRFDILEKVCIALNCTPNDILKLED